MMLRWKRSFARSALSFASALSAPRAARVRPKTLLSIALVAASAALGALAFSPAHAEAAADEAPQTMILNLATEVLDTIRADPAMRAGDFDAVQKLVNQRILPKVDFEKMTRLTVGRAWRGATAEQRATLTEQFRMLLMRTYSGALAKVSDQKVRLRPSRPEENPNDIIVRTQLVASQGDPIGIDYRLEKTDAGWKIYDLNILGVWLVENYKTEFAQSLNQGGIDNLIQVLTQKNQKLAAAAKS
jgi:phospholipid transport system substrate-binding protein